MIIQYPLPPQPENFSNYSLWGWLLILTFILVIVITLILEKKYEENNRTNTRNSEKSRNSIL